MTGGGRTARTFRIESLRAVSGGVLESAWSVFFLMVAVKVFAASPTEKALVSSGHGLGLLLTPVVVAVVAAWRVPAARAAAWVSAFAVGGFALATWPGSVAVFVAGAMLAQIASNAVIPLMTQVYQENYPSERRGQLFSRTVMIRIVAAGFAGWAGGWYLEGDLGRYRALMAVFAGAAGVSAALLLWVPSGPLERRARGWGAAFRGFGYAVEDTVFGRTLASWMLLGFGNLMMLPLRVEFMANPKYGLNFTPDAIALVVAVIPNAVRLAMNPLWGFLFDRLNFFLLRIALNVAFAFGVLAFFTGDSFAGLALGAVIFGMANAGGDLAWSLWVTKIAPPDRVADYMGVHTFLTGVRQLCAPFLAFYLAQGVPLATLGWVCAAMMFASTLLLVPEVRWFARRKVVPLIEDVGGER